MPEWAMDTIRLLILCGGLILTFYLTLRREARARLDQFETRLRELESTVNQMTGRLDERRAKAAEDFMDSLAQISRGNQPGP